MSNTHEAAGTAALAAQGATTRIRLTRPVLKELRLALLGYGSPFSVELELVEQRYDNGDVTVRLGRIDKPERGERILGAYKEAVRDAETARCRSSSASTGHYPVPRRC